MSIHVVDVHVFPPIQIQLMPSVVDVYRSSGHASHDFVFLKMNTWLRGVGEDVVETWIHKAALKLHWIYPLVDGFFCPLGI